MKLVLDLDNTLVATYTKESWSSIGRAPDHIITVSGESYGIYERPFLEPFLRACSQWFEVIIWTAGLEEYAQQAVKFIYPKDLTFPAVYSREKCTFTVDLKNFTSGLVKDLSKLPGFEPDKTLILDDKQESYKLNPENGIQLPEYLGAPRDEVLLIILPHLWSISKLQSVQFSTLRDWHWRSHRILVEHRGEFFDDCPDIFRKTMKHQ